MAESTQRIVPGAPPLPPLSKSQKKKRKSVKVKDGESPVVESVAIPDSTSAALVDKVPQESDIKEGSVAEELPVQPPTANGNETALLSPVVDIISKRLKVTTKKIVSGIHRRGFSPREIGWSSIFAPSSREFRAMRRRTPKNSTMTKDGR